MLFFKNIHFTNKIFHVRSKNLGHTIIVECDEDQHKDRSYSGCEIPRMINISQTIGQATVFIRFNPDKYSSKEKQWSTDRRYKLLREWIDHYINIEKPESFLTVIKLFYDGFNRDIKSEIIELFKNN